MKNIIKLQNELNQVTRQLLRTTEQGKRHALHAKRLRIKSALMSLGVEV